MEAVKYQLAIVFMIAGTASLTCMIVTLQRAQIKTDEGMDN
jgi:ABC-type iron transport system FetAB permease component